MLPVPRLWGVLLVAFLLSLFGTTPDVARAEEVDSALLDACPGYSATSIKVDGPMLTAKLILAGAPCNVFGNDIKLLDLTVVYETSTSAL
jgi:alpha-glucosidase